MRHLSSLAAACLLSAAASAQSFMLVWKDNTCTAIPVAKVDSVTFWTPTEADNYDANRVYLSETFYSGFGTFSVKTTKGTPWIIDFHTAKATGYASSKTTPSESYLVAPPVDLSQSKGAVVTFDYILRYVKDDAITKNRVLVTDNYTGDVKTTTWTNITGALQQGSNWDKFYKYAVALPQQFIGKPNVVIALHYACTSSSATWEVKNLKLREQAPVAEAPADNENRNAPYIAEAARLEFPRLRSDKDQRLLVRATSDYGMNYAVEWDTRLRTQRWTCFQMYGGNTVNHWSRYDWTTANNEWANRNYAIYGYYDPFQPDTDLVVSQRTNLSEYIDIRYQRGHICASADRLCSKEANEQTFLLTNIMPQTSELNTGIWAKMEDQLRAWNKDAFRDTLYVVKGGTIDNSGTVNGVKGYTDTGLLIPAYFYMAVLCKSAKGYKAIAFWTEHHETSHADDPLAGYCISIRELEQRTGIDFFCNLPDDIEDTVENTMTTADWGL